MTIQEWGVVMILIGLFGFILTGLYFILRAAGDSFDFVENIYYD